MPNPMTLTYGTYIFPNQSFELIGHKLMSDTPSTPIRRKDGGVVLDGNLLPKKFQINGKVWSNDKDTLHATLNILHQSLQNKGAAAYFQYRDDRRVLCRLAPEGIDMPYEKGLYQYVANLNVIMLAERPFAESTTLRTVSGVRTNNSNTDSLVNNGFYPTQPIFTFVAGTWAFMNDIYVGNVANSNYFRYQGPLISGQTLVVDCDSGCVLLQVGLTMVDAISYFAGDLFFKVEAGGLNTIVIDAATLSYSITNRDRFYL